MTENDIEHQLVMLQPAHQPELARQILATSYRRRQRRRDCFVGLAGLLTGIAATVLVMTFPFAQVESIPVVYEPPRAGGVSPPVVAPNESSVVQTGGLRPPLLRNETPVRSEMFLREEMFDLDVWIARYEKLLQNRRESAHQSVIIVPPRSVPVLPDGMSPLEYQEKLLREFVG